MRARTVNTPLAALLAAVLAAPPGAAGDGFRNAGPGREDATEKRLAALAGLLAALRENEEARRTVWSERERHEAEELGPPRAARGLVEEHRELERRLSLLLFELGQEAADDPGALLAFLERTEDAAAARALLPIVVRVALHDERTFAVLRGLAARLVPRPAALIEALATCRRREAALLLLEIGTSDRNVYALEGAARTGDPEVLERLIDLAEQRDSELAQLGRTAIARLAPPPSRRNELEAVLVARIRSTRSADLKAVLVAQLGLFRNPDHFLFLREVYKTDPGGKIRATALGALSQMGAPGGQFLLQELRRLRGRPALCRAAIQGLARARHRPAVEQLIELLEWPELAHDAVRALERISGERPGRSRGAWIRWWRGQPEAAADGGGREGT